MYGNQLPGQEKITQVGWFTDDEILSVKIRRTCLPAGRSASSAFYFLISNRKQYPLSRRFLTKHTFPLFFLIVQRNAPDRCFCFLFDLFFRFRSSIPMC